MPKLTGKDLASLYPRPKTFDELAQERERREKDRRPRFAPLKISLWVTLGVTLVLVAYELVSRIIMGSLSSEGAVIFGVSASVLLTAFVGAIMFYLYSLIRGIAAQILIFTSRLYTVLVAIVFIAAGILAALAQLGYNNIFTTVIVLLLIFSATYFAVNFVISHDSK